MAKTVSSGRTLSVYPQAFPKPSIYDKAASFPTRSLHSQWQRQNMYMVNLLSHFGFHTLLLLEKENLQCGVFLTGQVPHGQEPEESLSVHTTVAAPSVILPV